MTAVLAAVVILALVGVVGSAAVLPGTLPAPHGTAELAFGSGWRSFWSAHGKEVATVTACFLDGVAAARWLALGGGAMAAAGLIAAGLACFS